MSVRKILRLPAKMPLSRAAFAMYMTASPMGKDISFKETAREMPGLYLRSFRAE